jgi:hypothetical protein
MRLAEWKKKKRKRKRRRRRKREEWSKKGNLHTYTVSARK